MHLNSSNKTKSPTIGVFSTSYYLCHETTKYMPTMSNHEFVDNSLAIKAVHMKSFLHRTFMIHDFNKFSYRGQQGQHKNQL